MRRHSATYADAPDGPRQGRGELRDKPRRAVTRQRTETAPDGTRQGWGYPQKLWGAELRDKPRRTDLGAAPNPRPEGPPRPLNRRPVGIRTPLTGVP